MLKGTCGPAKDTCTTNICKVVHNKVLNIMPRRLKEMKRAKKFNLFQRENMGSSHKFIMHKLCQLVNIHQYKQFHT